MPLGTANGVLYLNGSKVATTGSALTFDGTNLAVGGTATEKIFTNGAFRLTGSQTTAGNGTYLSQPTTALGEIAHYGPDNSTIGQLRFYLASANGGIGGEQMRLTSTGLGIGTSSPARKLDVNGSIRITDGQSIEWGGTSLYIAGSSNTLIFGTSLSEKMRLDSSGNLGLGVTSFGTSAEKVIGIANGTAPTTSPAGIGQLYVEGGALKYRGSSGTVTTIANA